MRDERGFRYEDLDDRPDSAEWSRALRQREIEMEQRASRRRVWQCYGGLGLGLALIGGLVWLAR